ncbi:iron ABC transporter permease [Planosporangium thailandense]|uniref:Iron ABC transporter permease n=1 Tax=Planosporangium thailandense TaxID=765197 RepID=A0ABX0XTS1_9ACTN|nr:iron ABC transporter permease [Planosporangium thailandense]NJC68694.1 iron ABC transporter permease [Planosporangium thailandense]
MRKRWFAAGLAAVAVATVAGLAFGPVRLSPVGVALELLHLHSGLTPREAAIVTELRLPRVVLALLVGATLALAGGCYQGVFRNPLADPYLLGVAAGAGLGATAVIAVKHNAGSLAVPPAAFGGALVAVALTYVLGATGTRYRTPATLILAGVAVTSFLTAGQTYLQQRDAGTIREVYSWLLGRLSTAGWHDVLLMLPYAAVSAAVILVHGRSLDVLAVGDEEATSLGANPQRTRVLLIVAASLGTAAAVAVSGLIGFVGIIVPHTVRLLVGTGYRAILPLSALFGGAFLALADLAARLVLAPAEVPIGVVTAFLGAPFFIVVLRTVRQGSV